MTENQVPPTLVKRVAQNCYSACPEVALTRIDGIKSGSKLKPTASKYCSLQTFPFGFPLKVLKRVC